MKHKAAAGHAKKHAGTKKHAAGTAKHHPASKPVHHTAAKAAHHPKTAHAKAKHPAHTKARALSQAESRVRPGMTPFERRERLDGPGAWALADVACCSAEALAWSLRLAGWPVGAADVLALHKLTADSPDTGASILATLDAASVFGLAGVRPVSFRLAEGGGDPLGRAGEGGRHLVEVGQRDGDRGEHLCDGVAHALQPHLAPVDVHGLILGLELPGPHAVCQQDGQWWTWGEPYDPACFPDAVIEEAWAVTWP